MSLIGRLRNSDDVLYVEKKGHGAQMLYDLIRTSRMRVTQAKECGVTPRTGTITFDRTVGFGSNFRILLRLICVKGS